MRVLLVSANTEQINMPTLPLGLGYVAMACRRAGHEVRFLDLMAEEHPGDLIRETTEEFRPEVIGISVRNVDDQARENPRFLLRPIKRIVESCRAVSGVPIVLGGSGYSIFPQSSLDYLGADMGLQGEGEEAFPLLVQQLEGEGDLSAVPGLYLRERGLQARRSFIKDLDKLPSPEDHLWCCREDPDQEYWLPVQSRRGCPLDCTYCSTATIEGRTLRKRKPALVAEEMGRQAARGFRDFHVVDNTFNLPPSYARELCRRLTAMGLEIRWRCILYPWKVTEELVRDMAQAGCSEVSLGFESGSPSVLRAMNKRYTPGEVRQISEMLADYGIRRLGFLLLGGPGETKATVEESLTYADSLDLEMVKATVGIRIYPHTALASIAAAEGLISRADDLLFPRFYLARGLEQWLPETVRSWMAERPNWVS